MTTPSSASERAQDNFDTGPLSWVMDEIREALNRSKAAVHEAVTQDADARQTSMRHAKSYLHQAHGALQIVDVEGIAIITETVEDLFDRVDAGGIPLTAELAGAVGNACQALVEYLDELLSGAPHQPVRLFPYYRVLLEARGAERIHPADLFFPNLAVRPTLPATATAPSVTPADYAAMRQRFERALLPFLRSTDRAAELKNATAMQGIIGEIESLQGNPQARVFWWVMHGLAEEVSAGRIPNEIYVKQLFARINLQIRRLSQGSASIAERLLRDALFFIAKAENPGSRAQQIRAAYQLNGQVPEDYNQKRYGQVDSDALAAAKERLGQAKNMWNRIVGGDASAIESFELEMRALAEAGSRLNSPSLSKLLRELKGIARHAAHAQAGDMVGLEMATSLLFVENSLSHISRLSDDFSERADAMTARLLAIVSGEQPAQSAEWLDNMSREAQQRQMMTALAGELQANLRQVEKILDEYFRDPSHSESLAQLDPILHQIEGALAVLDQHDAMRATQHTRSAVRRFIEGGSENGPDQQEFQQVARNVGALSFFIETLQLQSEQAAKRFSFDEERGEFRVKPLEKTSPREVVLEETRFPGLTKQADETNVPDHASLGLQTVEDDLALHQRQSAELARSLTAEPTNPVLQEQLKESLEQIRQDAALVDNPEITGRAQAGIDMLKRGNLPESREELAGIITAVAPIKTENIQPPQPVAMAATPATDEAVDAELLEIFLSEAEEVLGAVKQVMPESRSQPHNQEHLTTLRRSFHTLKGSGRMVGLVSFGEAAWSIEQVLNLRLSESRAGDSELYALLEKAASVLGGWVEDLKLHGRSDRTPDALVRAAERVKAGDSFAYEEDTKPGEPAAIIPDIEAETDHDPLFGLVLEPAGFDTAAQQLDEQVVEVTGTTETTDTTETVGTDVLDAATEDFALPQVEEVQLSDADMAMFSVGADTEEAPATAHPGTDESGPAERKVSGAEVIDFPPVHTEIKHNDNVRRIGDVEISVPLHNIYLAETDELVRLLANDIAEWRHEPERQVSIQAVHAAHSLAGSSSTVGFAALHDVAHALEMVLQFLARNPVHLSQHEFDTFEQTIERLKLMLQKFALGEMPAHEPEYVRLLVSLRQNIEARALVDAKRAPVQKLDFALVEPDPDHDSPPDPLNATDKASFTDPAVVEAILSESDTAIDPTIVLNDELDADLLPVFLEEGRDILPQMGAQLRGWQQHPAESAAPQALLRLLHTLKGSARMAGAMALGQHLHDMETRIENIARLGAPAPLAIDDLMVRYDHGLQMFEQLQNPQASNVSLPDAGTTASETNAATQGEAQVVLSPLVPIQRANMQARPAMPRAASAQAVAAAPLVRVRADILDRLVNQAGEVSISRSRLETEVGTLKQSLSELTENVSRLRDQLREIEMQAETQITSRMGNSADREFDPLEFDRFTRLQELTRMMAESVNDVGSVHQNLSRTLDSAVDDLSMQARLTRDLQQDLMRVRMVQFASISERLFRVTRQAAKEIDKRVNLDIRGGAVEIDRGVLEKMTGPFEHLLRNAIVHGIESRETRRAAGKNEVGELLVEVRQEGNEVVIQFTDDGQGLNLARIRDKAKRVGLLTDGTELADNEAADLIFHPGFSTADEITELAGRGIGMDVVRSEAAALGGRVSTWTEPGKGTHFTIRLPLTLAVTQVVVLSTGGRTYAVPSVLVEQVQQLKTNALTAAYNEGAVIWQGQRVPMHYLSTLLGDKSASAVSQQYSPLLILKSGNDRVAVHVDEVIGNREVVVKNIGPQLARMIGIAGATVLGTGDIVLILNPVPLAQRIAQENMRAPRSLDSTIHPMGAVAEMSRQPPQSEPVQGLRTQNIVMVVDDSLTVRRVTQRLLSREGYQVVLAKDGVDALEHLQSVTPDVMLVDIEMPRMDGFDLTRNVRDDERTRHIPIVMITSRTATKHRNYALELGVNEYLGKPYQEDLLLNLVAGFVKKGSPVA